MSVRQEDGVDWCVLDAGLHQEAILWFLCPGYVTVKSNNNHMHRYDVVSNVSHDIVMGM